MVKKNKTTTKPEHPVQDIFTLAGEIKNLARVAARQYAGEVESILNEQTRAAARIETCLGGLGRGVCHVLCRRHYKMTGEKGAYTRKKGLDRETNKALLLKHIEENKDTGSRLSELMQVLPALSGTQVQTLLRELKSREKIYKQGATRAALWFSGPSAIASGIKDLMQS